jgi:hypothetical protein
VQVAEHLDADGLVAAGREGRRENTADAAEADDGHRAIRNSHAARPFMTMISAQEKRD